MHFERSVRRFLALAVLAVCGHLNCSAQEPWSTDTAAVPQLALAEMGRRLAIIPSPPSLPAPSLESAFAAYDLAASAGARGIYVAYPWSRLEPREGEYSGLADLSAALDYLTPRFDVFLHLEVIKTTVKEVPADLDALPFDSPRVTGALLALLDRIALMLPTSVRSLTIGTEVDIYFAAHGEAEAYLRLFQAAVAHLRAIAPRLAVGVSVTFEETQGERSAPLMRLRDASDFAEITYYALGDRFRPRGPQAITEDWERLLSFAAGKPLFLEVGYPSSKELGSSELAQSEFMQNAVGLWSMKRLPHVQVLNLFELHDESPASCAAEAEYYGAGSLRDAYIAYRCSLGLRSADGKPKLAWNRLFPLAKITP